MCVCINIYIYFFLSFFLYLDLYLVYIYKHTYIYVHIFYLYFFIYYFVYIYIYIYVSMACQLCTLLFQGDHGGAGAEPVPGGAVVSQLEVLRQRLGDDQGRDDPLAAAHCLHGEPAGGPGGQADISKRPHLEIEEEKERP